MMIPFSFWKSGVDVCKRFIKAHEEASGFPMDDYQKGVVCTFVDMLYGNGTTNGTDLMTRMIKDGTLLFPLCPTNDNDAYMAAFEIDLVSGKKMGEYVNMDESHITVQGALPDDNGQYFECYKTSLDYNLEPGYIFGYTKTECDVENAAMFGNANSGSYMTRFFPRATAGGGWSYQRWNGIEGSSLGPYANAKGQLGILKRASGIGQLYTTYRTGDKIVDYQNNSPAPTGRNSNRMFFHKTQPATAIYFKTRISMYCMGVQFTENEDTAFNDLSQAVEYFQENILSNDTRRWL